MRGPYLSLKVWGVYVVLLLVVAIAGSGAGSAYTAWLLRRPWPSEEE